MVPHCQSRPIGELDPHVVEAEVTIDIQQQLRHRHRLLRDLLLGDENVRIVLGESAHPHQPMQRSGRLVAVHLAELRQPDRELPVASQSVLEDLDVPRTIHRLDGVEALVRGPGEKHVLAELLQVPGLLP